VLAIDPINHILTKAINQGRLHSLLGRATVARTSLYADDAAIFVAPIKEDIACLASILGTFGEVTGFEANPQKSLVAPIQCDGLDLDDILQPFPASRTSFPMRYLGLPLSVYRLKRGDLQYLQDKIAGKFAAGNWKNVNMAGRRVLVRSVLTSQTIHHITSIDLPKGVTHSIMALLRAFLWAGKDKVTGASAKLIGTKFVVLPSLVALVSCTLRSLPPL
jgi:hypothetical protein